MPLTTFFACMLGFFAIVLLICGFYTYEVEVVFIGGLFFVLAVFIFFSGVLIRKNVEEKDTKPSNNEIGKLIQKNHYRSHKEHWASIERKRFLEQNKSEDKR